MLAAWMDVSHDCGQVAKPRCGATVAWKQRKGERPEWGNFGVYESCEMILSSNIFIDTIIDYDYSFVNFTSVHVNIKRRATYVFDPFP